MLRVIILFLLLLPVYCIAQKEHNTIIGKVVNHRDEPIEGANIKLLVKDTSGIIIGFSFSDKLGQFSLKLPNAVNPLYLQISYVGYITQTILVTDSIVQAVNRFLLHPLAGELPEVHVIADRGITKRGDTTSFKVSYFAKGNEENITDLIKRLPGFQLDESGSLLFNGKRISAVLVEDDDLFGRNYAKLINNASTYGIEKVEVIENYKNIDKLENSILAGKQTVVNLKYKKMGISNFGEAKLGYAPFSDQHEVKLSLTSLSKKVKGITIGNKNQIGNLTHSLYGVYNEQGIANGLASDQSAGIEHISTDLGIPSVQPININRNRIFDNNSSLISANLLLKPVKKVIFKSNYAFVADNYIQGYRNTITYLNALLPNTITEDYQINKKLSSLYADGELSINWKPIHQTRINYTIAGSSATQLSNGFFQSRPLQQSVDNCNRLANISILHTTILKANSYLNIKYLFQKSNSNGIYQFNNPLEDTVFMITANTKVLQQNITNDQEAHFFSLNWLKKTSNWDWSASLHQTNKTFTPATKAFFTSTSNQVTGMPDAFNVQSNIRIQESLLNLAASREFNKRLKIDLNTKINYLQYQYGLKADRKQDHALLFLPGIALGWRIANAQTLRINTALIAGLPGLAQLNSASRITHVNGIASGSTALNIRRGWELELNYNWYDPTEKKIILNISSGYTNTPNIYNNNFSVRGLYVFSDLTPFFNNNHNYYLNSTVEKNLVVWKSWLKFGLLANYTNSYSSTLTALTSNQSRVVQADIRFSTNWSRWFNINTALVYNTSRSVASVDNLFRNVFRGSDWLINTNIELQLHKQVFLDLQYDQLLNQSFNQPRRQIQFFDARLRYVLNKQWTASTLLRNMLNTKSFITNQTAIAGNTVQDFSLTPFIGLCSIGYKF